jgi:hypothetical protein
MKTTHTIKFAIQTFLLLLMAVSHLSADDLSKPIVKEAVEFIEVDGLVAVEAEHFYKQSLTEKRAFYLTSKDNTPKFEMDGDPTHVGGASNGAYLEILPDTRRNHGEKLIPGENFSNEPGKLAVVHYKVNFANAGRYYVWVRAHSTGSEDNGLHVGVNGTWPESGRRLQWCIGKQTWRWDSMQRTKKEHCGVPHQIFLDIEKPGVHEIHFSLREDGFEFDKFILTKDKNFKRPEDAGPASKSSVEVPTFEMVAAPAKTQEPQDNKPKTSPTTPFSRLPLIMPRKPDGDGSISLTGETKTWHKLTLSLDGPFAHEQDNQPNPFVDYDFRVEFKHSDGTTYKVPGYFAADGNAGESSAESGTIWRAHFAPDRIGSWEYTANLHQGKKVAINSGGRREVIQRGKGSFEVTASDKTGRDLRAHGRLKYVGKRYLQHAGSGNYFLKAGADAPETLLGYADFDNTIAGKPKGVPLKTFAAHINDWQPGDPVWKGEKGKGLIGAINYLSAKGCNAFSFLTYNAGGDGDNVWPFIHRDDKLHYDCSKLDQWSMVLDHGTAKGMYLHFKMQETENDDHVQKQNKPGFVPTSLDGGALGDQRKLYIRELVARFGHNLALNWNLGEENTQTTKDQKAMIDFIADMDAYDHSIVLHTYPGQQDKIYNKLIGDQSQLTGLSLQNSHIKDTHWQVVKWVEKSEKSGRPWIVAFDESGSAAHGQCPDLGYRGFDGSDKDGNPTYTQHEVRRQTLWGALMGGGAGVEYYFGYKFAENDLVCEDWRSRDQSWDYCRIALEFFNDNKIPIADMTPADELVGNQKHDNSKYCLAQANEIYLVYLPKGEASELDLSNASGKFTLGWFNPRAGGAVSTEPELSLEGGKTISIPAKGDGEDWLAIIQRANQ